MQETFRSQNSKHAVEKWNKLSVPNF